MKKIYCISFLCISCTQKPNISSSNTFKAENVTRKQSQEDITAEKSKSAKPKLNSEEAKKIISETAKEVTLAISNLNMDKLASFIHPEKGIRFSQYGIVDKDCDLVFNALQVKSFLKDDKTYTWGVYDGSGEPIELTPEKYFYKFVHVPDFSKAEKVGYNEIITESGYTENQFLVYPDSIIVEYYFTGIEYPQEWESVRIVFEEYQGNWYIVGIIHNQWTI